MRIKSLFFILMFFILGGCSTTSIERVGISEDDWLKSVWAKRLVYLDSDVKAYMHDFKYYYFMNGKLIRIDTGVIPAQTIRLEVR